MEPAVALPICAIDKRGTKWNTRFIKHLFGTGYSKKILWGHDIYSKHRLKKYGGHGYSYILEMILMRMITMGISQKDVNKMIIENPKNILTLV